MRRRTRVIWSGATAALTAALVTAAASAGVVQTLNERRTGRVALRDGGVTVEGKAIATEEVLFAVLDRQGGTFRQRNTIHLTNGEVWHGDILGLSDGKLRVRLPLIGTKEVDSSAVRALEFQAKLGPEDGLETNRLYRKEGEPLPGKILWINREQVAVDSPLGAIAMDREGSTRFLLAKAHRSKASDGEAEVVLVDGSVLRGRLTLGRNSITLDHAALGKLGIPAAAVRSFLRHVPRGVHLSELDFLAKTTPLLGSGPAGDQVKVLPPGRTGGDGTCVQSLVIRPETELRVRLPDNSGGAWTFRATAAPLATARGDVMLRVLAGGKALLVKRLAASTKNPAPISVSLGGSRSMTIEVTFDQRARFPCGVVLGDPHVVRHGGT